MNRIHCSPISLHITPERYTVRNAKSRRFIHVQLDAARVDMAQQRPPVALSLVIDRSGSMSGQPLVMARKATAGVIAQLDARDRFAVVAFDDTVTVIQPQAFATDDIKRRVIAQLDAIAPGGSTALHEGWQKGCEMLWADAAPAPDAGLRRVFLLTDGQANHGLTDPSEITRLASLMREQHRVSTTTFGIGHGYQRELLLRMAQGGGGEFHHLLTGQDIVTTFSHELRELFTVVAPGVRIEAAIDSDATLEMITPTWTDGSAIAPRLTVPIGDLISGETRHLVLRAAFPHGINGHVAIRARALWNEGETETVTTTLHHADDATCDADTANPTVLHWTGLHRAQRAIIRATAMMEAGQAPQAQSYLRSIRHAIERTAQGNAELLQEVARLRAYEGDIRHRRTDEAYYREATYSSARRSKGKGDARGLGRW